VAEIIQFVTRADRAEEAGEVDLLTAVDAAIRDLSDILAHWGEDTSREQAEDCRRMLEQAFNAAV
jgi:plasmid stabilization system protein ParE